MRRRSALVALGAAAVLAAVTGGVLFLGDGDDAGASGPGGDLPPATVSVVRTDLVRSTTVDGRLDFSQRRTVRSAVEGTVTVTAPRAGRWPWGRRCTN